MYKRQFKLLYLKKVLFTKITHAEFFAPSDFALFNCIPAESLTFKKKNLRKIDAADERGKHLKLVKSLLELQIGQN
jgi:hypothetical protein